MKVPGPGRRTPFFWGQVARRRDAGPNPSSCLENRAPWSRLPAPPPLQPSPAHLQNPPQSEPRLRARGGSHDHLLRFSLSMRHAAFSRYVNAPSVSTADLRGRWEGGGVLIRVAPDTRSGPRPTDSYLNLDAGEAGHILPGRGQDQILVYTRGTAPRSGGGGGAWFPTAQQTGQEVTAEHWYQR